jgi:hypothetical protein
MKPARNSKISYKKVEERNKVKDGIAVLVHSCKLPFLLDVYGEKLQFTILWRSSRRQQKENLQSCIQLKYTN